MPRRKGSEVEDDEDYDPYDSFDDSRRVRQRGEGPGGILHKSSRGRLVKARQYNDDDSDTEEEEYQQDAHRPNFLQRRAEENFGNQYEEEYSRAAPQKSKPAKRQRWVPHNPLITGGDDDDDSRDPQISDVDAENETESGDESASRSRRRSAENRLKGGSIPLRDESGKFIGVRAQTAAERQATATGMKGQGGGGIFKTAAITVLREERRLMSTGEIARIALKRGYIKVQGRTPEATMASAMYTDVKRKEDRSTFIRPHEGLFGLREWQDEGVHFKDPIEDKYPDESTQSVLRRSRISGTPQMARANSRGSGAGHRVPRSNPTGPAFDNFFQASSQSQGNSHRGEGGLDRDEIGSQRADDISIGLPPRIAAGLQGLEGKGPSPLGPRGFQQLPPPAATPFGGTRGGPSPEIFKSRFSDGGNRPGFVPTGKRSLSGGFQHAHSAGRKQRKPGPSMSQQDSGNMLALLSAVEDMKSADARNKGLSSRAPGLSDRRHPSAGGMHRREGPEGERPLHTLQLTIQGFNASRIAGMQNPSTSHGPHHQSDQVNILNLPLLEVDKEEGSLDKPDEPPPGVEIDPARDYAPPGAEAALDALDNAFGSAPLTMAGSFSGPLAPAIQMPHELLRNHTAASDVLLPELPSALSLAATAVAAHPHEAIILPAAAAHSAAAAHETAAAAAPRPQSAAAVVTSPLQPAGELSFMSPSQHQAGITGTPEAHFGPPELGAKRLQEVEAAVKHLENSLGAGHPKVGKGYLYLSKVYQCLATPEYYDRAQKALKHAYEICFACQKTSQ